MIGPVVFLVVCIVEYKCHSHELGRYCYRHMLSNSQQIWCNMIGRLVFPAVSMLLYKPLGYLCMFYTGSCSSKDIHLDSDTAPHGGKFWYTHWNILWMCSFCILLNHKKKDGINYGHSELYQREAKVLSWVMTFKVTRYLCFNLGNGSSENSP